MHYTRISLLPLLSTGIEIPIVWYIEGNMYTNTHMWINYTQFRSQTLDHPEHHAVDQLNTTRCFQLFVISNITYSFTFTFLSFNFSQDQQKVTFAHYLHQFIWPDA